MDRIDSIRKKVRVEPGHLEYTGLLVDIPKDFHDLISALDSAQAEVERLRQHWEGAVYILGEPEYLDQGAANVRLGTVRQIAKEALEPEAVGDEEITDKEDAQDGRTS